MPGRSPGSRGPCRIDTAQLTPASLDAGNLSFSFFPPDQAGRAREACLEADLRESVSILLPIDARHAICFIH